MNMINQEERPWWQELNLCRGINKDGSRCKRYRAKAYEKQPGDLVIPSMCSLHSNQENSK